MTGADLTILTAAFFKTAEPIHRLAESCARFGATLVPYGVGESFTSWREAKIDRLAAEVEKVRTPLVMYADGQDTFLVSSPDAIVAQFEAMDRGAGVVVAGERNPFPECPNWDVFTSGRTPDYPFVFPNAGVFIGRTEAVRSLLEEMRAMGLGANDQAYWQSIPDRYVVDRAGAICACLSDDGIGDGQTWRWTDIDGRAYLARSIFSNHLLPTRILHFNGGNKEERMAPVWAEWRSRFG